LVVLNIVLVQGGRFIITKFIFLLLFPFLAYSQAVSWSEKVLITESTISGSSKSASWSFAGSSGFSLQNYITCLGACTVTIRILGSVDGVTYIEIPELTKTYTATENVLYNIYMQFFKWMKVQVQESSGNSATVKTIIGIKTQL